MTAAFFNFALLALIMSAVILLGGSYLLALFIACAVYLAVIVWSLW